MLGTNLKHEKLATFEVCLPPLYDRDGPTAAAGVVLMTLTITLAPIIGMLGAAPALLARYVALNAILAVMVWYMLGVRSDVWSIVHVFIAKRPTRLPGPRPTAFQQPPI